MFKSAGLAKMFAGRRKFFRGPHVRHLCSRLFLQRTIELTYFAKYWRKWAPIIEAPSSSIEKQPTDQSGNEVRDTERQDEAHEYISPAKQKKT